ncbi:MAG TPA: hypothetical protein VGP68_05575 [Gemmataceae bacterium]|jgi:hypothetical protein|nr:hypothetical protein [Gemmataceae bacterium]
MKSCGKLALVLSLLFGQTAFGQNPTEKTTAVDRDLLTGVEDNVPVRNADENFAETRAYDYLLIHAREFSAADLRSQARSDLTFVHLFEEPAKYRGQLVTLKGRLRRLLRFDPPPLAGKEGVKNLYEGWLYAGGAFTNPFCILASEIGPDLTVGEKIDREVTFTGYFLKRYRYKAGDGWRDAPLLIGRSIEPVAEVAEPVPSLFGSIYLPVLFGILGAALLLALGLAWRLRLGDKKVRNRLQQLREEQGSKRQGIVDEFRRT